jgi:hypothetical protein
MCLIIWSHGWGIRTEWLRLAIVIGSCPFLALLVFRLSSRLRALPGPPRDTPEVRKWTRLVYISAALLLILAVAMQVDIRLRVRALEGPSAGGAVAPQFDVHGWAFSFWLATTIYILLYIPLMATAIWALAKRNRARFPKDGSDRV